MIKYEKGEIINMAHQTTVFDNAVKSFNGREFTIEEIKNALNNNSEWNSNDTYIKRFIKDRL